MKNTLWLFAAFLMITSCTKDEPSTTTKMNFQFKFDSTQERLNGFGEPSIIPTNHAAQNPDFNRGIWKKIEEQIRVWSYMYGELIIITGPILECENFGKIGTNSVTIPKWYYKVVIDPDNYKRNLAILIENTGSSNSLKSYVITIDKLEEFSGIDFFYRLPDLIEESFESSKNLNLWYWKN